MDNENELDYNLDEIMQQLREASALESPDQGVPDAPAAEAVSFEETTYTQLFAEAASDPETDAGSAFAAAAAGEEISDDTDPLPQIPAEAYEESEPENAAPADADVPPDSSAPAADEMPSEHLPPEEEAPESPARELEEVPQEQEEEPPKAIPLSRSEQLRELKRKLVAGPEKLYYKLSGEGVGKLQIAMILNFIILMLCCIAVFLYTKGAVPASRNKLMVYTQVLAMMVSGLLGIGIIMDGIDDLLHLHYSPNTALAVTFFACMADAWFSLDEQRVPFCSAFVLEMSLAMLANYHRRTTELAQLDTMRKATELTSLVKEPKYYANRPAILRGQGDVDDFMDTYSRISTPEIVQRVYALIALLACIGIAVLTGILHGVSMAVKIFSTSLLVSLPAGYFIALTRPASILEKRLHMVGAVLCGWQGVKKLCGRAVVPLRDKDLFPKGSIKLNGIKFYSDRPNAEVFSYASSLIIASGGGLVPLFRSLLNNRNAEQYPVDAFRDYGHGGIGGEIDGESVLAGNLEFLQEMGVEVPQGTMVNQAVYVAIDGELAAVIAISYSKMRSAAAGIVSLCGCRKLKTLLLAGDFMMTDKFIREKFSIRTKRLILPTPEERSELAAICADPEADVLALITRDDLLSTAYAVTGAMALRRTSIIATVFNLIGGIGGILIMLALSYLGSTELLTPARILLYQVVWLIPTIAATEGTRIV